MPYITRFKQVRRRDTLIIINLILDYNGYYIRFKKITA